jgi:hypothetical protein
MWLVCQVFVYDVPRHDDCPAPRGGDKTYVQKKPLVGDKHYNKKKKKRAIDKRTYKKTALQNKRTHKKSERLRTIWNRSELIAHSKPQYSLDVLVCRVFVYDSSGSAFCLWFCPARFCYEIVGPAPWDDTLKTYGQNAPEVSNVPHKKKKRRTKAPVS